jgi:hypothetical protein
MNVVEVYEDKARSGGSVMGRGGLLRLLDQARERSFDVVVVEALDRLSRDMEDLAGIHKRLSFLGIEIRAVHEGVVNTVLVGLRGLVGQLCREDNAHKVRRGLAGRVGQGLNAGGRLMAMFLQSAIRASGSWACETRFLRLVECVVPRSVAWTFALRRQRSHVRIGRPHWVGRSAARWYVPCSFEGGHDD